jgi:hypothetical protein
MALVDAARAEQNPLLAGLGNDRLTALLGAAQAAIERWCQREFERASRTEKYDGDGSGELMLRCYPLVSLDDVVVVEPDDTETELDPEDFRTNPETGEIWFKPFVENSDYDYFPRGKRNIEIEYTAGYGEAGEGEGGEGEPEPVEFNIPEDLIEGVVQMAAFIENLNRQDTTAATEASGSYSRTLIPGLTYKEADLPPAVRTLVGRFKDFKVA